MKAVFCRSPVHFVSILCFLQHPRLHDRVLHRGQQYLASVFLQTSHVPSIFRFFVPDDSPFSIVISIPASQTPRFARLLASAKMFCCHSSSLTCGVVESSGTTSALGAVSLSSILFLLPSYFQDLISQKEPQQEKKPKVVFVYKRKGIGMVAVSLHIQRASPQSKYRKSHYIHSYHGMPKTKSQSFDHVADGRGLH